MEAMALPDDMKINPDVTKMEALDPGSFAEQKEDTPITKKH